MKKMKCNRKNNKFVFKNLNKKTLIIQGLAGAKLVKSRFLKINKLSLRELIKSLKKP